MARFEVGKVIVTDEPQIVVDPGLPAGEHVFQLIVEDSAGNQSAPDQIRVRIVAPIR